MKWSQHVMSDIFSCPLTKLSKENLLAMQQFVKSKQFKPTKCFYKEQLNENSLIVENKFNPISSGPCVYFGTKLKVLIQILKEKSNSLHQFIN